MKREDFVNLNRARKKLHTDHFIISAMQNGRGLTRLGITVSKRIGNSVVRNRIKRLIREFYRLHKALFPRGYDVVVTARKSAGDLDFWKIKRELGHIILDKSFSSPS